MANLINNIKKYFIYIVGILFFIVAIYIMLMPPNCALNKMSMKECFTTDANMTTVKYTTGTTGTCSNKDYSIKCYRNIVSQKLENPQKSFDIDYLALNQQIIPESMPGSRKTLIMSRCYQFKSESEMSKLLTNSIKTYTRSNAFISYTESIQIPKTNDFNDVLKKIDNNINAFHKKYNSLYNKTNKTPEKIKGCIYVIISQVPYYLDTSNPKVPSVINIANNILPQSLDPSEPLINYPPSIVGNISSITINPGASTSQNTNIKIDTPITYNVFIIYDAFKIDSNNNILIVNTNVDKTFSTSTTTFSKNNLDATYLSGAEQCYMSTIGGGMDYIGGCTSYNTTLGNTTQQTMCQSPIQGTTDPWWSYVVLYTVNRPDIIENIVYTPK